MTLTHHFLENSAARFPDKCALVHEKRRVTYAELNRATSNLAGYLLANGCHRGDRVVILFENSVEYVAGYYGILKAGAVAVPLNPEIKAEGLWPLLAELEPWGIITGHRQQGMLKALDLPAAGIRHQIVREPRDLGTGKGIKTVSWEEVVSSGSGRDPGAQVAEGDLASIIYTSGSTGKPKGVMLSHRNIVANTRSIVEYLELSDQDTQMVVLPFFYVMGKSLLNTHMAVGARVVINNKFTYPATVVAQMVEEQVTGFSGVPSTFAYLLHRSPLASRRDELVALRYCSQAGGHLDRTTKERLLEVLPPHVRMYVMYGATEAAARLSYVEPSRVRDKIDSIGQAIPGVNLKVVDEKGRELSAGEIGEIVASGENIMQGYWKDPASTAAVLSASGYHTGDLGYRDEEGYFFAVGRKDNQLKVGGHRVNTQEIEDVIMATGLVVEVAVLGMPDPLQGHKLIAVAVPVDQEQSANELLALCAGKIPKFKLPQEVLFVRGLPKNPSGKVNRQQCMAIASDLLEKDRPNLFATDAHG